MANGVEPLGDPAAATALRPENHKPRDGGSARSLAIQWRMWRNRQIGSQRFRHWMARLPWTRWLAQRKANQLFQLVAGFTQTQILTTCVRLDLFAHLDGCAQTTEQLAHTCKLEAARMREVLELAQHLNLVIEIQPNSWMLDDAGAVLASDRGLREMIRHHEILYRDLQDPVALWRNETTDTGLRRYWAYVRTQTPAECPDSAVAPYTALMRESQAMLADCILSSHDFARYQSVLDIGGGDGAFLSALGNRYHALKLGLFDLPAVATAAETQISRAGMADRTRIHGGDFFEDMIPSDFACVTLLRVLCDHEDDRVRRLLANLHRSLAPGTHLVIAEAMAGPSSGERLAAAYFGIYFRAMGSGRCRTAGEISTLLRDSGFQNPQIISTVNPLLATLITGAR
ncbi:methyltransferase [Rhizobium sp. G187]|uniref:methyltransferase n=1 Tax=Rhizobium sp. G187 TaxID=3451352 RepID=UPI003EE62227